MQLQSDRWTDVTAENTEPASTWPEPQIEIGAHTLVDLLVEVRLTDQVTISSGGKYLLDQDYELVWGLPQAGRSFDVTMRAEL